MLTCSTIVSMSANLTPMTSNYIPHWKQTLIFLTCRRNSLMFTNVYDKWQLGISYSKCNLMYVSNTRCNENLFLNINILPVVDGVKDLHRYGLTPHIHTSYRSNCCYRAFTHHIDKIVATFTWANLIYKFFLLCDAVSLTRSFTVYVRPLLEYRLYIQVKLFR